MPDVNRSATPPNYLQRFYSALSSLRILLRLKARARRPWRARSAGDGPLDRRSISASPLRLAPTEPLLRSVQIRSRRICHSTLSRPPPYERRRERRRTPRSARRPEGRRAGCPK